PQIPDGFGARMPAGDVVACNDVHCQLCKANYMTCNTCQTANGWYLASNQCQSASTSPTFATGFGPDTTLGTVVACSLSHCLDCRTDYTVCTACDKASGWYLNTVSNKCESATTSPKFTTGYGPNLDTGKAVL